MPTDPQVQASAIQTIGAALFGSAGTGVFSWFRSRGRSSQGDRCERVCLNLVGAVEGMLAVMEAIGADHPNLNNAIIKARVQIDHARSFLNGDEV